MVFLFASESQVPDILAEDFYSIRVFPSRCLSADFFYSDHDSQGHVQNERRILNEGIIIVRIIVKE